MKHRTSELVGKALDVAVALAEGHTLQRNGDALCVVDADSALLGDIELPVDDLGGYAPSADWYFGGPIIERERISFSRNTWFDDGEWQAQSAMVKLPRPEHIAPTYIYSGPTPLIAAMRAYVASKLGEEVELP